MLTITECFIGIDPAFRDNGFTICTVANDLIFGNGVYVKFQTLRKPHLFFSYHNNFVYEKFIYGIENSNLTKQTFLHSNKDGVQNRFSRNAGMNMAVSQMVCDFLKDLGAKVYEFTPKQKGKKESQQIFELRCRELKVYNIPKKTTQDERDAFKLAYLAIKQYNFDRRRNDR